MTLVNNFEASIFAMAFYYWKKSQILNEFVKNNFVFNIHLENLHFQIFLYFLNFFI